MAAKRFETVDEYLASLDEAKRETMSGIIDLVVAEFPELEAKIAWNLPMVHMQGKYVLGLAAYKKHISVSLWSTTIIEDFAPRLADYVVTKNLFQVPVDWKIDAPLICDMVAARLAEVQRERDAKAQ